jgi:hypothetical protein
MCEQRSVVSLMKQIYFSVDQLREGFTVGEMCLLKPSLSYHCFSSPSVCTISITCYLPYPPLHHQTCSRDASLTLTYLSSAPLNASKFAV